MTEPVPRAVIEGLCEVARDHLGHQGELPLGARLVEDLELDSVQLLTLAVEIENHFRVCLDEEEQPIETVEDLARMIHEKLIQKECSAEGVAKP